MKRGREAEVKRQKLRIDHTGSKIQNNQRGFPHNFNGQQLRGF